MRKRNALFILLIICAFVFVGCSKETNVTTDTKENSDVKAEYQYELDDGTIIQEIYSN